MRQFAGLKSLDKRGFEPFLLLNFFLDRSTSVPDLILAD